MFCKLILCFNSKCNRAITTIICIIKGICIVKGTRLTWYTYEVLLGWVGRGTCSLVPLKIIGIFPCSPNENLDVLRSMFPKTAFVPLFPSILDFCSLVPLKKWPYSHVPQNPRGRASHIVIFTNETTPLRARQPTSEKGSTLKGKK